MTTADTGDAPTTSVDRLSDQFVADICRLSLLAAIQLGRARPDDVELDDLSPVGLRRSRDLAAATHAAVSAAPDEDAGDPIARSVITERLGLEIDKVDSGWSEADLNVIASPVQHVRMLFDVMPKGSRRRLELGSEADAVGACRARRLPGEPGRGRRPRSGRRPAAGRQVRRAVRDVRRRR